MFAVKGWSLSAEKLKRESDGTTPEPEKAPRLPPPPGPAATGANAVAGPPKKRKRPPRAPEVTADNVVELWERVIEKKRKRPEKKSHAKVEDASGEDVPEDKPLSRRAKKLKRAAEGKEAGEAAKQPAEEAPAKPLPAKPLTAKEKPTKVANGEKTSSSASDKPQTKAKKPNEKKKHQEDRTEQKEGQGDAKKQKKNKGDKKSKEAKKTTDAKSAVESSTSAVAPAPAPAPAPTSAPAPAPLALTPLQAAMRAKLVSARFRHLNETLYTRPSAEAVRLFADSPDMFQAYHEGFRQQVAVWPENPVDGYIAEVKRRGKRDARDKKGRVQATGDLPRTRGTCHLADVGCGDARLAAALAGGPGARLRVEVRSYDLYADPAINPHITAADAAALPLEAGSMDVVVSCLALMGTNWLAFVEEAYRVLRWKGELWIAEIKSRFAGAAELRARAGAAAKQRGPVAHSVGQRRKLAAAKKAKGTSGGDDDDEVDPDAVAEIDGPEETTAGGGNTTDVSAFVRALRRRGFVLDENASTPAVDVNNKMFVKMRFLKAAPAVVGKEATAPAGGKAKLKFLDETTTLDDPMDDPALEAKILKPCVYKLR